ncbi:MAG: type I glyceraldehyde-3-phosphate dehydrogenase [Bacteroidetes bacterium]|nr:type I glyceraldehyde-3-phosphate dehydrogenase [Bacteroidota bacterium]PHX83322.1 MAG: type I glyceraldehyde-3-phosphate dehydrogenase [Flavobacteriales bacterium]
MKPIKVAINGFGRIGRVSLRVIFERNDIEVVAINDLADARTLAHLLKYDSVHRRFPGEVIVDGNSIIVNGKSIPVTAEKDPSKLNWGKFETDIVIESTGRFLDIPSATMHLKAGAKKVLLSAPPDGNDIKSIVMGVNDSILTKDDLIISNASCTTNCAAPMIKVLDDNWGIADGYITTIHSYTGDQRLHDSPHKDLRRARAAAVSMVPTSTGAAKAITKIFPHLDGKLGGCGIRVPVPDGSLTDITCVLNKLASVQEINAAFKKASEGALKGVLEYTEDPIVSIDCVGNPHSCIYDAEFTSVVGNMVKLMGWYDNEMGYSSRLVDLIQKMWK